MQDNKKTKKELIQELLKVRTRLSKLEVSEKKHQNFEKSLKEENVELSTIFNNAPIIMILVDKDRRLRKANHATILFMGRPEKEILGIRGGEAFRCIHSLENPKGCGFGTFCETCSVRNSVMDTFESGRSHFRVNALLPISRENRRQELHLLVSTKLVTILDNQMVLVCLEDIREQKKYEKELMQSENRYKLLLDAITSYVYTVKIDSGKPVKTLHGSRCREVTGYTSAEYEKEPYLWIDMVHDEDKYLVKNQVEEIISGKTVTALEHRIVHKNGSIQWVRNIPVPFFNEKGELISYDGIIEDITERKKTEKEILKTKNLESIGILAGGIAHDFNNILTAITGHLSLLKLKENFDVEILKRLNEIEKAAERAQGLTQQLLTFSKGGSPVKKATIMIEHIKNSVNLALKNSNVKCRFFLPKNLLPVEVDIGQISQVINNLVINAGQAMPEGGTITVRAENYVIDEAQSIPLHTGKYIKISIKDHGIGIPEEHLPNLFVPYFTTKKEGKGLGLASSYSIINNHGGLITAESQFGTGTTLTIYLPAVQNGKPSVISPKHDFLEGKGKILVMDDEEAIREVVHSMLKYLGFEVACAKDGNEAIEFYKENMQNKKPFKIVLMDLTIPGGLGGKETIKKLIEINPEVTAVVSSGYSNDPVMANYKKYGFKGVIVKPYTINELNEVLQEVIKDIQN